MNLGADDYITKPFDDVELLEAIEIRLAKSERIKKSFDGTVQGLNAFVNEAKGQQDLEKLSSSRALKKYAKKDFIYQEGEHPRYLFFIATGKIKISRSNEIGKEYITKVYSSSDFIGYNALISDTPYQESAIAIEEAEVSLIPKEDFLALLYNNRDFSAQFIKMLANNVEEKEDQLLDLAYNSIRKRVADALLHLDKTEDAQSQHAISILRDDLAAMVGTAKESVIRTLADFKKEGLIEVNGGTINILDVQGLKDLPN